MPKNLCRHCLGPLRPLHEANLFPPFTIAALQVAVYLMEKRLHSLHWGEYSRNTSSGDCPGLQVQPLTWYVEKWGGLMACKLGCCLTLAWTCAFLVVIPCIWLKIHEEPNLMHLRNYVVMSARTCHMDVCLCPCSEAPRTHHHVPIESSKKKKKFVLLLIELSCFFFFLLFMPCHHLRSMSTP